MQLGLLGKQNLAMNPKRRKRLRRLGNDFGHICFKVSLPTNCVESRCKYGVLGKQNLAMNPKEEKD